MTTFLCWGSLVLALALAPLLAREPRAPNVVFILVDDMGYVDLGCYGNPYNETPHLDGLAAAGMRFTQAYAAPACSPSRAALMTGMAPARLKITTALGLGRTDPASPVNPPQTAAALPGEAVTLAEKLRDAGYRTGMIGKWHLGTSAGTRPEDQGFSFVRKITKNELNYYHYEISDGEGVVYSDDGTSYMTDQLTEYALEFLGQDHREPFFLYLAYTVPHVYIIPKSQNLEKYLRKYNRFGGEYNPYYASMIDNLDENVGRILSALDASGKREDTLIVFMSDNGGVGMDQLGPTPTSVRPLRGWKGHVYEGGVRVPLILSWKDRIRAGRVEDTPVIIEDFFPTLLDLAGAESSVDAIEGRSLKSVISGEHHAFTPRNLYWHFPHFTGQGGRPAAALRSGSWKLVQNLETGIFELYNLEADLSERHDVLKEHPEVARQLIADMMRWRDEVGADMPTQKK